MGQFNRGLPARSLSARFTFAGRVERSAMNNSPPLYRIVDWDTIFENNRTRELKRLDWIPVPNKHDTDGYTELLDHPNGTAHYGAWLLMAQVASKCDPRGTLLREGQIPHTPQTIARRSHSSAAVIEEAIPRLLKIRWLEVVVVKPDALTAIPQEGATPPQEGASSRARDLNGMEGNGMEENTHREGNGKLARVSRMRLRLNQLFKRDQQAPWSCMEEQALCDIAKRPEAELELSEIVTFKPTVEPRYFPQTLERLLNSWTGTLDRSRGDGAQSTWKELEAKKQAKENRIKMLRHSYAQENPDGTYTWPKGRTMEKAECVSLATEVEEIEKQLAGAKV
jgi:hypothetical protein